MNCRTSLTIAALFAFTSSSALANPGQPLPTGLIDADGDGYFTAAPGGTFDSSNAAHGDEDCDDSAASVFPSAPEVVGDGVDQDCVNGDLVLPVTEQVFARFVAAEYGGVRPTAEVFTHEFNGCTAASGQCKVNLVDARFEIIDADYVFQDLKDNRTGVLHCGRDGREVVTAVAWSHTPHCKGRSGGGIGKSTVIRLAEETVTAALATYDEGIQAQFAEIAAQQVALERRVDGIERIAAENQGNIAANGEAIARNTAAIGGLQTWRAGVDQTNARQDTQIAAARSEGMSLWVTPTYRYLNIGHIAGTLDEETTVFRKSNHTFTGVGGRLAYTNPVFSAYFTGEMGWGGDGHGGAKDSLWLVGAGGMYHFQEKAQGLHLGGHVHGGTLSSNTNALEYSARAGLVMGEVEFGYDIARSSIWDAGVAVFAGFGRDSYGVYGLEDGEESVFDGNSNATTLGVRLFVGPSPTEATIERPTR